MKERIIGFVKTYVLFVLLFMLQKPLFMLFHSGMFTDVGAGSWLAVMGHGLPLDFSLAGYLSAIPGLLYLLTAWTLAPWLRRVWCGYFVLVSVLMSLMFVVDVVLYPYWGFRLDATPLFYFFSSPKDTLASAGIWMMLGGFLAIVAYAAVLYALFYVVLLRRSLFKRFKLPYRRLRMSLVMLVLTAVLFIPIRGGFTVATMNTGQVYFSSNQRLNHAAINPIFSLMESLSKQKDFAAQYRFMEEEVADSLFRSMLDPAVRDTLTASATPMWQPDSTSTLFTNRRPHVLLLILESFSSRLMGSLGGFSNVAVQLDSLAGQGVLFTRFYANSFRTDRGLVSILSGYPAQPTTSLMKYPRKSQTLPAIARTLRQAGYRTSYYYGGDANFTNMRSYLMSSGFGTIVSDEDFPVSQRLSKWGVHDHLVFDRLLEDLQAEADAGADTVPSYRVLQTSSSHEPFEVPYRRLQNAPLNAFAYTDSCVGDFIRRFSQLPQWKNTVVVMVPDHLGGYPEVLDNFVLDRYQIPLLMVGGAISTHRRIEAIGSQQDIAATLLAQLGLQHSDFTFSKNLMDTLAPHFAFFTVPDAVGLVTDSGSVIYDCQSASIPWKEGADSHLQRAQAYLQKLYDDIAKR